MKKLRLALCGCRGKAETFVELVNGYEESEIAAVWDPQEDGRGAQIAEQYGCTLENDYDRLLAEYSLDGVIIAAENALHKELIIKAAKAGVGVFVEKPLYVSAADAREIQKAVKESGVTFFMSDPFVRRGTLKVKKLIEDGVLGEITGARFRLGMGNAVRNHVDYNKEKVQGGIMADVGGHMIHKAHYLFGKPQKLSASLSYYTEKGKANGIEENAIVVMQYPKEVLVTMECSWVSGAMTSAEEIYGTKGAAIVSPYGTEKNAEMVTVKVGRDQVQTYCGDDLPPMPTRHIRYFVEMLLKHSENDIVGKDPLSNSGVSIDNAVEFVEIIEAIYKSANKGFIDL
ncbi:MAG: Gfo/Idh/MocA family oxidoreductase [Lachnospiraceae bacterium]|nr:Gfo/Idh/MocA family oxidoreductase [Lachnospiraceae bacterium]